MNWIPLQSLHQLEEIKKQSAENPVLIFKHSTRCSTSRMSLDRLERNWDGNEMKKVTAYFLDLISYREVSNMVEQLFGIQHESPQVLLISNGESILDLSHFEIDYGAIKKSVKS